MAIRIDDDVRAVLEASTITATELKLPGEQLERKLYERVAKVLKAAGGKWSRKAQAHVFRKDPRQALGLALEAGEIVSEQQRLQAFYTSPELAAKVARLAQLHPRCTVLEPSAGEGALIKAALEVFPGLDVTAYDINPDVIASLLGLGVTAEAQDFLTLDPFVKGQKVYDRILMNPPFAKSQDVRHALHALHFLALGGRLVAIVSPSAITGEQKEQLMFQRVIGAAQAGVIEVEAGAFKSSGTQVATRIVVVDESPALHAALIAEGLHGAYESIIAVRDDLSERAAVLKNREAEADISGPGGVDGQLDLFEEVLR